MTGSGGGIGTGGLTSDEITADAPATWNTATAALGVDVSEVDIGQTTGTIPASRVPDAIPQSDMGVGNGIATLGADGKVPSAELNVAGGFNYLGSWNANTNTPTLANATGTNGDLYKVSTAGTQDLGAGPVVFQVGDHVVYDGAAWENFGSSEAVSSVNGKTGVVVVDKNDVGLGNVDDTSDVDKPVSTAQQTAINGRVAKTGDSMSGNLDMNSNKVTDLADPTDNNDAANKEYVDAVENQLSDKVSKSGDTMSGILSMGSNKIADLDTPTNDTDAANKSYVDSHAGGPGSVGVPETIHPDPNGVVLDSNSPILLVNPGANSSVSVSISASPGRVFTFINLASVQTRISLAGSGTRINDNPWFDLNSEWNYVKIIIGSSTRGYVLAAGTGSEPS